MHGIMEMLFTICYKGVTIMKSKRDKMLCNTLVSITYKWSYSEDHVHTFFEPCMSEDTMIRIEGTKA